MDSLKKIFTYGLIVLGLSFGMTVSASEFTDTQRLAEQGDANSQNKLGNMYSNGEGVSQDYNKAFSWYKKSATQGNSEAQLSLGVLYAGLRGDEVEGFKWMYKAAEQGNAEALLNIGMAYEHGVGVSSDVDESKKWYRKACDKGIESGCLSSMSELDNLKKLADEGNMSAQNNLGVRYYKGEGVDQNYEKAFNYLLKAAEQGDAKSQSSIASMYLDGIGTGVPPDRVEAILWFNTACMNGSKSGCNNLKQMGK